MKKIGLLLLAVLVVGAYAYFAVFQQEKNKESSQSLLKDSPVKRIELYSKQADLVLEQIEGLWWIVKPHYYLADQEVVTRALTAMTQTPVVQSFVLTTDNFGLKPGKAFFHFVFEDKESVRLIVGEASAPNNHLYVLNKDSNQVQVVHNVWAQMLYSKLADYNLKTLPIPGKQVKAIRLSQNGQVLWSVEPGGENKVRVELKGQKYTISKAKLLWFFKKVREFKLENLEFDHNSQQMNAQIHLDVEHNKGNIRFLIQEKDHKILVPKFSLMAEYKGYSLEVLESELAKAVKNVKK